MKKKTIVASVLLGVLLIGIVTAGLVPYLSNMVSGSVVVEGPVFYAHSGNQLEINEYSGGTVYHTIDNLGDEIFWGDELSEVMDFYKPELTLYALANLTEGIEPKNLDLIFEYIDDNGGAHDICKTSVLVNIGGDYQELSGSCTGDSELKNVKKFIYTIKGKGDVGVVYKIKIEGYTKVEMDKAT